MPSPVAHGARLWCSCGVKESTLRVARRGVRSGSEGELAVIDDCLPLVNISPFGGCHASANPFPAPPGSCKPCMPRFGSRWSDEVAGITLQGKRLIEQSATLACDYGGTVRIVDPMQQGAKLHDNKLNSSRGPLAGAFKGGHK